MTEVIELSSSDDDCAQNINENNSDSDTTVETDIGDILNKFKLINNEKTNETKNKTKTKEAISSSEDEYDTISNLRSLRERLEQKYKLPSTSKNTNLLLEDIEPKNDDLSQSGSQDLSSEDLENSPPKSKKRKAVSNEDKNSKKLEKEQEKARKQAEKKQKKAEVAAAKAEKQAVASAYKNLRPDECIKCITTIIDSDLMSSECGTDIPNNLQTSNITYKINSNIHPFTITWKKNNQAQLTNINGQLKVTKNEDHCEEVLLILLWNEFVKLVHENNLCNHFKTLQSILPGKKIFLAIYGTDNYFKAYKSQKQSKTGKDKIYLASPKISRKDADMALIELQLLFSISHRFVETAQEVSALVLHFTKAIAQKPYKLQKEQKQQQLDWYVSGDNKDCVRVDRNGNGLYRLWQQQLTQLPMARLELAEAVTSKYSSPAALIKAYEKCTKEDGQKLLEDIPIRRSAGPLTSVRKIGPEFSKKIYTLFTSLEGDVQL